jgi:hypothetical protein
VPQIDFCLLSSRKFHVVWEKLGHGLVSAYDQFVIDRNAHQKRHDALADRENFVLRLRPVRHGTHRPAQAGIFATEIGLVDKFAALDHHDGMDFLFGRFVQHLPERAKNCSIQPGVFGR